MFKNLLVPGLNGSAQGHWQRFWLDDQPEAQIVEQDSWQRPELAAWQQRLEQAILANPGAILIGHSLGCLLIASLAGRPVAALVGGAMLVAPCELGVTESLHPGRIRFGIMPDRPLPFPTLAVGSRSDPYMPFETFQHWASRWGCISTDIGHAGHINIASGFGRWADGYDLCAALRAKAARHGWNRKETPDLPPAAANAVEHRHGLPR